MTDPYMGEHLSSWRRERIVDALHALEALMSCNGWREALANSPEDQTLEWVGPRVYSAVDSLKRALRRKGE